MSWPCGEFLKGEIMKDGRDYWEKDDFEDTVASALIACFETKLKRDRMCDERDKLTEERLSILRKEGPYIPGRFEQVTVLEKEGRHFITSPVARRGVFAFRPEGNFTQGYLGESYLVAISFRPAAALGKNWHSMRHGEPFEVVFLGAGNDGIKGDRRFVTLAKDGEVRAAQHRGHDRSVGFGFGRKQVVVSSDDDSMFWESHWAAMAMEVSENRRESWVISAQESSALAHLGCMMEEVKSLLYARSLPMTATGRKRPILHLVESHKRRMRNGIDVDVTAFLRGQQTVEIGGTVFKVNPPATLRSDVSKPSRDRYFAPVAG